MRDRRIVLTVAFAVILSLLGVVYFFFDPVEAKWMPKCIWKMATGTECPGCGSQRMAHALMHGDLAAAWRANAYALCMLPLIGVLLWLEFSRVSHPRFYRLMHSPAVVLALGISILGWWVLRNLI